MFAPGHLDVADGLGDHDAVVVVIVVIACCVCSA